MESHITLPGVSDFAGCGFTLVFSGTVGKFQQSKSIRKSRYLHFHWTERGGSLVAKKQFKTLDDALAFMDKRHINKNKFNVYVCPDCGMWHIGHRRR